MGKEVLLLYDQELEKSRVPPCSLDRGFEEATAPGPFTVTMTVAVRVTNKYGAHGVVSYTPCWFW